MSTKNLIVLLLVLAAIGAAFVWFTNTSYTPKFEYSSETYGISFTYPEGYALQEGERGNGERGHYAIVLVRAEDANPPQNGEGPTAITLDIYQNNIDNLSLTQWLDTAQSNYKLAKGPYSQIQVAGKEAVSYEWSGLYEGKTTAFLQGGNIIAISVTYLTPQDENIDVYNSLLRSLKLGTQMTEEAAISAAQQQFPELLSYPSDNLPPKRIEASQGDGGWYLGFLTEGSGRPGILEARCYFVSNQGALRPTGTFSAGTSTTETVSLQTCTAL